jgi:hypothetical protein
MLPRRPESVGRRGTGLVLAGLVAFGLASGCSGAAEKVEFVVYFTPQATDMQKDALRTACPGVGRARLEPRDRNSTALSRTYPVRYDITSAGERDRGDLTRCVAAQPGVRGVGLERGGD